MQKIEIKALTKRFGRKLLFRGVNVVFTSGVHGIAGPNGSGKSTFLKCVAGLQKPTSGEIVFYHGNEILKQSDRLLHTAFSAPYINLYPELTVFENLAFISRLLSKPTDSLKQILDRLGIRALQTQSYGSLSSGQQQRVRLASALIKDASILFLDEPGTNLDSDGNALIDSLISDYRDNGRLVLLASNQSRELDLCDKILHINDFKHEGIKIV